MKIGTLFGVDIIINKLLIVLLVIASFYGYLETLSLLFFIIFVHDFCHTLAARVFNLKVKEIELMPFGGVARIESLFGLNPGAEIFIAAAGPLSNIIMSMIAVFLHSYYNVQISNFSLFVEYNLMLAGFNLLPALPLDGGRMLRAILSKAVGIKKGTLIAVNMGKALAIIISLWGIYGIYRGVFNPTAFTISAFMMYSAIKEQRFATYIFLRDITYKKDSLLKKGAMPIRQLAVRASSPLKEIIDKFNPNRYHIIIVLEDKLRVIGNISESELVNGLIEYGSGIRIGKLLK